MPRSDDVSRNALARAQAEGWAAALPLLLQTLEEDRNHREAASKVFAYASK